MKKILFTVIILLTSLVIFSFKSATESEEITISVTSDKQTTFDMYQDSKTVRGLKTPYEVKLKSHDSKFIFKSRNTKAGLKVQANTEGGELSASWPITVLLVNGDKLTAFGLY